MTRSVYRIGGRLPVLRSGSMPPILSPASTAVLAVPADDTSPTTRPCRVPGCPAVIDTHYRFQTCHTCHAHAMAGARQVRAEAEAQQQALTERRREYGRRLAAEMKARRAEQHALKGTGAASVVPSIDAVIEPADPQPTMVRDLTGALTRVDARLRHPHREAVHHGAWRRQEVGDHALHPLYHERDDLHAQEQPALLLLEGTGFVPVRLNILITGIRSGTSSRAFAA